MSSIYTDVFLLLSGALTAYHMAKELKTRGEIRWFCRFVARFIRYFRNERILAVVQLKLKKKLIVPSPTHVRLSPALLAVVFWYAFVMEHVGSGPQWNSVVTANAELCKNNAWTNLLYVQNFLPFEEMVSRRRATDKKKTFMDRIHRIFYSVPRIRISWPWTCSCRFWRLS